MEGNQKGLAATPTTFGNAIMTTCHTGMGGHLFSDQDAREKAGSWREAGKSRPDVPGCKQNKCVAGANPWLVLVGLGNRVGGLGSLAPDEPLSLASSAELRYGAHCTSVLRTSVPHLILYGISAMRPTKDGGW